MDHLGELISRRRNSLVHAGVECEVRHAGTYIAWKYGVTRASLKSWQTVITSYLATQETRARVGSGDGGGGNPAEVPVTVSGCFREMVRMVPCTDVKLAIAYQDYIDIEPRSPNDRNRLGEERERYHRERDMSAAKNSILETQVCRLTY